MKYKVVETSMVTDADIEAILNEWVSKGYVFESIQFVVSASSRRPGMAFLFFTKQESEATRGEEKGTPAEDVKALNSQVVRN